MSQTISNLPVGARVKFGRHQVNTESAQDIVWTVVAKNMRTWGYPANSVTLHSTYIIDMRCFDAREPASPSTTRNQYGNGLYGVSNMHQWLNSRAGALQWYSAQHSTDAAPDSSGVMYGTHHSNRPGFLHLFTDPEYSLIDTTTIVTPLKEGDIYWDDENATLVEVEHTPAKVFLPSDAEVGLGELTGLPGGLNWGYYTDDNSRRCSVTAQAYNNSKSGKKPSTITYFEWWLRTPTFYDDYGVYSIMSNGGVSSTAAYDGSLGIRPALNISPSALVSDTTDSSGCYTLVLNSVPTTPAYINVPTTVVGDQEVSLSWDSSTDADGSVEGYILECSYNEGEFVEIYRGNKTNYSHLVTFGETSIQYRVCAYDNQGANSGYAVSAIKTILNNRVPVISGTDSHLGNKTEGFTQTYSVTDADGDVVTVVEAVDGNTIRSYAVTLGADNSFILNGEDWLRLNNGSHTMTITATDIVGNVVVRTYTFVKTNYSLTVQNTTPYEADTRPTRIKLTITRSIPSGAILEVYVCNNGFDTNPTWENASSAIKSGLVYVFQNTIKTASSWGVRIKVVINRNGAEGACYISQIGGNFE